MRLLLALISITLFSKCTLAYDISSLQVAGSRYTCALAVADDGWVLISSDRGYFRYRRGSFYPLARLLDTNPRHTYNDFPVAINSVSQIIGNSYCVDETLPGPCERLAYPRPFISKDGLKYTPVLAESPDQMLFFVVLGTNDQASFVGQYTDTSDRAHAFMSVLGSGLYNISKSGADFVDPTAISSDSKWVAGNQTDPKYMTTAWVLYQGRFTDISIPRANYTTATGVYANGWVVGTYGRGLADAERMSGYIYHGGRIFYFNVPGSSQTQINGANSSGALVGCYDDFKGTHGFIATR